MRLDMMMAAGMTAFKQKLEEFCGVQCEQGISAEVAGAMTLGINEAVAAAGRATFKAFVESKDVRLALCQWYWAYSNRFM